jgi:hypothetical protein
MPTGKPVCVMTRAPCAFSIALSLSRPTLFAGHVPEIRHLAPSTHPRDPALIRRLVTPPPTAELARAAGLCSTALYENNGPIIELNRVKRLAPRRLGKKKSEILLRLVGFSNLSQ